MTADFTSIEVERRLTTIETTLDARLPTFATKADIQSIKVDLQAFRAEWKADLGAVAAELHAARAEWKADLGVVTAELHAARAEWKADLHGLTRWMVIAVLGSVTAAAAVTGLIVRFFS